MRNALVDGLVACAGIPDERGRGGSCGDSRSMNWQFIAGFVGSQILESADVSARIVEYAANYSADLDLKMILLREYLCSAGILQPEPTVRCRPDAAAGSSEIAPNVASY